MKDQDQSKPSLKKCSSLHGHPGLRRLGSALGPPILKWVKCTEEMPLATGLVQSFVFATSSHIFLNAEHIVLAVYTLGSQRCCTFPSSESWSPAAASTERPIKPQLVDSQISKVLIKAQDLLQLTRLGIERVAMQPWGDKVPLARSFHICQNYYRPKANVSVLATENKT